MAANRDGVTVSILLLRLIIVVSAPVMIVLANYAFLLSSNGYLYSLAAATATTENALQQMTGETATAASKDVIAYVKGDESEMQYVSYFRPEELSHLVDVRALMSASFALMYLLAVIIAASIAWIYVISHKTATFIFALRQAFFWAGIAIVALVVLILVASFSFDLAFTAFHKLLFRSGQWQFPSDYLLVNLFTADFFARVARDILLGSFFFGVSLIASAVAARRFIHASSNRVINVGK